MNTSTQISQKHADEDSVSHSARKSTRLHILASAFLTLMMLGAKLNAQNCVVNITQSPNTPVCAGNQVTLSASASAINIGTGASGALTVSSTYYADATRAAVTGTNNGGTKKVRVASTAGFSSGDEVITITMIDSTGILAGQYEFNNIASIFLCRHHRECIRPHTVTPML